MNAQRFAHLADFHDRVQGERSWKIMPTFFVLQLALPSNRNLGPSRNDLAKETSSLPGEQTHEDRAIRLTGAGFTHDAQGFPPALTCRSTPRGRITPMDLNVSEVPTSRSESKYSSSPLRSRTEGVTVVTPMKLNHSEPAE